jgi:hypothetical protein
LAGIVLYAADRDLGSTEMKNFYVADLNAQGELKDVAPYTYGDLEQIPGAAHIITEMSTHLWRLPEEFDAPLLIGRKDITLRWKAVAPTAGIATVRFDEAPSTSSGQAQLASFSLLASGLNAEADQITLQAFQRHLLTELRDTGYEPAFALMDLRQRPLVATVGFASPPDPQRQLLVALADRCFAAAYFRYLQLA